MELVFPEIPLDMDTILNFLNGVFVFRIRSHLVASDKSVHLKGQMFRLEEPEGAESGGERLAFVCSLNVSSVNQLLERGLYLSDLPLHDATRDLILLNQSRMSQVELK